MTGLPQPCTLSHHLSLFDQVSNRVGSNQSGPSGPATQGCGHAQRRGRSDQIRFDRTDAVWMAGMVLRQGLPDSLEPFQPLGL